MGIIGLQVAYLRVQVVTVSNLETLAAHDVTHERVLFTNCLNSVIMMRLTFEWRPLAGLTLNYTLYYIHLYRFVLF